MGKEGSLPPFEIAAVDAVLDLFGQVIVRRDWPERRLVENDADGILQFRRSANGT